MVSGRSPASAGTRCAALRSAPPLLRSDLLRRCAAACSALIFGALRAGLLHELLRPARRAGPVRRALRRAHPGLRRRGLRQAHRRPHAHRKVQGHGRPEDAAGARLPLREHGRELGPAQPLGGHRRAAARPEALAVGARPHRELRARPRPRLWAVRRPRHDGLRAQPGAVRPRVHGRRVARQAQDRLVQERCLLRGGPRRQASLQGPGRGHRALPQDGRCHEQVRL